MEEDEVKTERAQFPKVLSEHTSFIKEDREVHAWVAELLRNSGEGNAYETMERVVTKKNTNVYLKAMEESENKGGKPK